MVNCQLIFGAVAIAFAGFAAMPCFDPQIELATFAKDDNDSSNLQTAIIETDQYTRLNDFFMSDGTRCHAWLYLPKQYADVTDKMEQTGGTESGDIKNVTASSSSSSSSSSSFLLPPVVVLGHGIGSQKDMGLQRYAEEFARNGIASYVIDYRNFGGSDGEPRNLIHPWRHIADYKAAINHITASGLEGKVDHLRLGLWGTSFSGGHVLEVAADLKANVSCVVSQAPHLDGRGASKRAVKMKGATKTLRMLHAVLKDLARSFMGASPAYIKIAGRGDELALMSMSESEYVTYFSKHPDQYLGGWMNLAPARIGAMLGRYNPINAVERVDAPILFVGASKDRLCPMEDIERAVDKAKYGQLLKMDAEHFNLYGGEKLRVIIAKMVNFFNENLV